MYNVTDNFSLANIDEWINIINQGLKNKGPIPLLLVGGKNDLVDEKIIHDELAQEIAKDNGFFSVIECSSKTGDNIEEIFISIARTMMERAGML